MPLPVKALGTIGFLGSVAAIGNDGQSAFVFDLLTYFCAVIGLVGCDGQGRAGRVENLFDDLAVMDLPACYSEVQRPTLAVDNGMDFRGSTTPAEANRLIFLPPFAPLAARWAFTIVLSMRCKLSRDFDAS